MKNVILFQYRSPVLHVRWFLKNIKNIVKQIADIRINVVWRNITITQIVSLQIKPNLPFSSKVQCYKYAIAQKRGMTCYLVVHGCPCLFIISLFDFQRFYSLIKITCWSSDHHQI